MRKSFFLFIFLLLSSKTLLLAQSVTLMKDLNEGFGSFTYSSSSAVAKNVVFFAADNGKFGGELAKSDGTTDGTVVVKDIWEGEESSAPHAFHAINSTIYFIAKDSKAGAELWKSDGTEDGTTLVKDIKEGPEDADFYVPFNEDETFVHIGKKLYFIVDDNVWESDGTEEGTLQITETGGAFDLRVFNNKIYFIGDALNDGFGDTVFSWDPITKVLTEIVVHGQNNFFGLPRDLYVSTNGIYFTQSEKLYLIKADNTFSLVKQFAFTNAFKFTNTQAIYKDKYYFIAVNSNTDGYQLWSTDGTNAGTKMVKKIAGNFTDETFGYFTVSGNYLYFLYNVDPSQPKDLYRTDGTDAGTIKLTSFSSGGMSFVRKQDRLVNWKNKIYFVETTGSLSSLWASDGTVSNTKKINEINNKSAFRQFTIGLNPINSGIIFSAETSIDPNLGEEIWKYSVPSPDMTAVKIQQSETIKCFGDNTAAFTSLVTGGTAPYIYDWTNDISGLANIPAGNYMVTVTDDYGKFLVEEILVAQPNEIALTVTTTANSATIQASGGTGALTYKWDTTPVQTTATASSLKAGTYTCTITDANGCTKTSTVNLSSAFSATIVLTTPLKCNGDKDGALTAVPIGGGPTYTYLWSNGVKTAENKNLVAGTYSCTINDGTASKVVTYNLTQPTKLNLLINTTPTIPITGNNSGMASVVASGGTVPYTYVWITGAKTPTIENLPIGSYFVTVTDANGCTAFAEAIIKAFFQATITKTGDIRCAGENNVKLEASVPGGTGTYTYKWNTLQTTKVIENVGAGVYTVTITEGANTVVSSITVTEPPFFTAVPGVTISDVTNTTGSASVLAVGGTPPYFYQWNTTPPQVTPIIKDLASGTYLCLVTDANGCATPLSIIVKGTIATTLSQSATIKCNGDKTASITATTTGGKSPYTYKWDNSITTPTNLGAGVYKVTATDAFGVTTTSSVTIVEPTSITITTTTAATTPIKKAGTAKATVTGGTAPYTYAWSTSPAQTTQEATGLAPGSYTVTVTDGNGCKQTSAAVIKDNTSTNEFAEQIGLSIFPNPASTILNIEMKLPSNEAFDYQINDIAGKNILSGQLTNNQINVEMLAEGMYLLILKDKKNNIAVSNITIMK